MSHDVLLIILASLFGLFLTWGVGANDLANVLSPALGSKGITPRQAIIIAILFELGGALLGGGKVATTVQQGIINLELFQHVPAMLVHGMLASLLASSVWIFSASRLGVPVSLTNSIVGSIVGFGILVLGWHALYWQTIGFIGISWLLCPFGAGMLAYLLFLLMQHLILSTDQPLQNAKRQLPLLLFMVGFVLAEITVIKLLRHFDIYVKWWMNIIIAAVVGGLVAVVGQKFLKKIYVKADLTYKEEFVLVEKAFSHLMLLTVCAMVYAHGSDDIATSTGPVAAVMSLLQHDFGLTKNNLLLVILGCGYVGVLLGFLTYGRKVIATVGSSITELTPSRAFCATLAAASTVVISTNLGFPVSATQTLVGAIFGVGLARGIGALDLRVVRKIFMSWFITIPITAVLTAVFYYVFKFIF